MIIVAILSVDGGDLSSHELILNFAFLFINKKSLSKCSWRSLSDMPLLAISSRGGYIAENSDENFIQSAFNSIDIILNFIFNKKLLSPNLDHSTYFI